MKKMNRKKRAFCGALTGLLLAGMVQAASAVTISVNQFVEHPSLDAIYQGMQDYLKEKGIAATYNYHTAQANMGTTVQIAKQQIGEEADFIVAIATPSAQACAQAISKAPDNLKRPLIFAGITDPVAAGLLSDLQHPDGQITGTSDKLPLDRQIGMIREILGDLDSIGMIYNAGEANSKTVLAQLNALADEQGFRVVEATASKTADVYQAAKSLGGKVDAIFVPTDNTIVAAIESLVKVSIQTKTPLFSADVNSVKRGAVAALGIDYYRQGRETGELIEKIMKKTPVSDLPVVMQKDLELHINLRSAEGMGVHFTKELIATATKVYEQ